MSNVKRMYPVPKLAQHIEQEWKQELATYYGRPEKEVTERVRPWFAFPTGQVRIELVDDSFVEFKYAIYIVSEAKKAIAVFTEHCGHHVYPYHDAKIFRDGVLVYEQQDV